MLCGTSTLRISREQAGGVRGCLPDPTMTEEALSSALSASSLESVGERAARRAAWALMRSLPQFRICGRGVSARAHPARLGARGRAGERPAEARRGAAKRVALV